MYEWLHFLLNLNSSFFVERISMSMFLSIIIPLYNEQDLVIQVLDKLLALQYPDFVDQYEILIVDDCSSDGSYEKVMQYSNNNPHIRCVKQECNHGKGAAVRKGISLASGDVFLIQDADLELSPADIPRMLNVMRNLGVEFVNGSRYLPGIERPLSSYKRYLFNRFFTFLTSILINVKLTDMACGYKLFHRNLVNRLKLHENRFGFEAELIIKALRIKRNNITEVPVQYFPRNEGEGKKLQHFDGIKIFWTVIKYGLFRAD
jgi:glycosyltransferase involved in cell wall biosynthesis